MPSTSVKRPRSPARAAGSSAWRAAWALSDQSPSFGGACGLLGAQQLFRAGGVADARRDAGVARREQRLLRGAFVAGDESKGGQAAVAVLALAELFQRDVAVAENFLQRGFARGSVLASRFRPAAPRVHRSARSCARRARRAPCRCRQSSKVQAVSCAAAVAAVAERHGHKQPATYATLHHDPRVHSRAVHSVHLSPLAGEVASERAGRAKPVNATSAPAAWRAPGCAASRRRRSSAAGGSACRRP